MKDRKLAQNALQSFQRLFRESEVFQLTDLQSATDAFIAADFVDEFVVGVPSLPDICCCFRYQAFGVYLIGTGDLLHKPPEVLVSPQALS